jgi:hypothetical protein
VEKRRRIITSPHSFAHLLISQSEITANTGMKMVALKQRNRQQWKKES